MFIPTPFIPDILTHKPFIYTNIVSTIIAPHGITDLIHSYQQNKTKELLFVNTGITTTSYLLSLHTDLLYILDISFMISSIIHFRHDMPCIFHIPKYIWCILLLLCSIYGSHDLFYVYMCIIHIPKHYHLNRHHIQQNIVVNMSIIIITTLLLNHLNDFLYYPVLFNISKGIIISHIIYQELYIHYTYT